MLMVDDYTIKRKSEFKDVFIKGYNLSKKYLDDKKLTNKFQDYIFQSMKYIYLINRKLGIAN